MIVNLKKLNSVVLFTLLVSIPSYKFIPGIGASPLGALWYLCNLSKVKVKNIIFLLMITILLLTAIKSFAGFSELILLLVGPVILITAQSTGLRLSEKATVIVLFTLLLDAALGNLGLSDTRGGSLIMKEPSHAGRLFYFILSLYIINFGTVNVRMLIFSVLFLILNRSMFGAIYALFCILMWLSLNWNFYRLTKITLILAIFLAVFTTLPKVQHFRFIQQTRSIAEHVIYTNSLNDFLTVGVMTALGSRRLTQSIAGYITATPLGNGLGTGSQLTEKSGTTFFDLSSNKRIASFSPDPGSYISQLAFEAGYIRCFIFSILLLCLINFKINIITMFGIFLVVSVSSTTMPFAWLYLAMGSKK